MKTLMGEPPGVSDIELRVVAEIIRRIEAGGPLRREWLRAPDLSDEEKRRLRGAFIELRTAMPRVCCTAPVKPPCAKEPISSHSIGRGGPLTLLGTTGHVRLLSYGQIIGEPDAEMKLVELKRKLAGPKK